MQICPAWNGPHLHRARERLLRVGVGEDDARRLAAELEQDARHARRDGLLDPLADGGAAGEGHHVDLGRADERVADLRAGAADEVEDAGRQHVGDDPAERATPSGSTGAGFTTTVLPHASAGPIFPAQFVIGKLKGVMQATTPIGSRTTTPPEASGSSTGVAASSAHFARRTGTAPTCWVSATSADGAGLRDRQLDEAGHLAAEALRRLVQQRAALGAAHRAPRDRARTPSRAARAAARTCAAEHDGARTGGLLGGRGRRRGTCPRRRGTHAPPISTSSQTGTDIRIRRPSP
jgi:hypothetical protein